MAFNSLSAGKNQGKIDDFHIFINISAGTVTAVFQASSYLKEG